MDTRRVAREYKLAKWVKIVEARLELGQSITDYCKSEGISRNTYFYWQRRLREATCEQIATQKTAENTIVPRGWTRWEASETPTDEQALTMEISGCRVHITEKTDAQLLLKVCKVLKSL